MRSVIRIAVLVCAGTLTLCAQRGADVNAESKVLALERLWGQAAQLRDIKALDTIFDESLSYVHIDGRFMTKAQVLADTKAVSAVEIVVESETARVHGSAVIVTGVLRLKGVEGGKPYLQHGRFVDTWLYKKGRWVCVASMTTPMER